MLRVITLYRIGKTLHRATASLIYLCMAGELYVASPDDYGGFSWYSPFLRLGTRHTIIRFFMSIPTARPIPGVMVFANGIVRCAVRFFRHRFSIFSHGYQA